MDEKLKQIEDALNNLLGESKNYDPRTEEGYRNVIDKLSEIRNNSKSVMWLLYEKISGMSINEVLDDLYKKATLIYNEANKSQNNVEHEEKIPECASCEGCEYCNDCEYRDICADEDSEYDDIELDNDDTSRIAEDYNNIPHIVEDYLDETIGDKDMPLQKYRAIKQSLIDYTKWLLD